MGEGMKSVLLYESFYEAAQEAPPEDRLAFYEAVMEYSLYGTEPDLKGMAKMLFIMAKPNIDARNDRASAGRKGGRPAKQKPEDTEEENHRLSETETNGFENEKPMVSEKTKNEKPMVSQKAENPKSKGEGEGEAEEEAEVKGEVEAEEEAEGFEKTNPPVIADAITPPSGGKARRASPEKKGGQNRFIPPTVDQVRAYCRDKGYDIDPQTFVDFYASKGWMVGSNRMKDWQASVRTWVQKRKSENAKPDRLEGIRRWAAKGGSDDPGGIFDSGYVDQVGPHEYVS